MNHPSIFQRVIRAKAFLLASTVTLTGIGIVEPRLGKLLEFASLALLKTNLEFFEPGPIPQTNPIVGFCLVIVGLGFFRALMKDDRKIVRVERIDEHTDRGAIIWLKTYDPNFNPESAERFLEEFARSQREQLKEDAKMTAHVETNKTEDLRSRASAAIRSTIRFNYRRVTKFLATWRSKKGSHHSGE